MLKCYRISECHSSPTLLHLLQEAGRRERKKADLGTGGEGMNGDGDCPAEGDMGLPVEILHQCT